MTGGTRNVLVVEDQVLIGLEMQDTLTALGYRVIGPYTDMAAGLNAAATQDIDFGLLDFDLGQGENSTPIAKALTSRGLPFAFVTGTESSIVRASFGKSMVLTKPVDERLLDRVLSSA